jgi:hypothetical protein
VKAQAAHSVAAALRLRVMNLMIYACQIRKPLIQIEASQDRMASGAAMRCAAAFGLDSARLIFRWYWVRFKQHSQRTIAQE